jgi:hypothetical protein
MLMDRIKKSYRGMTRHTNAVQPIVTVPDTRPAANASNFSESETQARRLRRQRRLERATRHGNLGWSVRSW